MHINNIEDVVANAPNTHTRRWVHRKMYKQKIFSIIIGVSMIPLSTFGTAFGKCPFKGYEITGIVQEEKANQSIADAKLYFFMDDAQNTFANGYETEYPDYFKTGAKGSFKATAHFDTYSGWFLSDRCNKTPKNLTVIITAKGYLTKRNVYKLKNLIGPDDVINLPPILLSK